MAALRYKSILIIATGQYDKTKGGWLPIVDLSWGTDPYRGAHVITDFSRLCQTKVEAENIGIETGKAWVDARLTGKEPGERKGGMDVCLAPTATQAGSRIARSGH
jgi:hypothetical protein